MDDNKFIKRKDIRLKQYDYSASGCYFITVCTSDKKHLLSTIRVGGGALDAPIVELSKYGKVVENEIISMNSIYENVKVTDYVIMPNHIHLLIMIDDNGRSGAPAPTRANAIIPRYISTLKRFTNKKCGIKIWQRSYYDHIIRSEADYMEKWEYMKNNPEKWVDDEYYSD